MPRPVLWLVVSCLPGILLVLAVAWWTAPAMPARAQPLPTVQLRAMGAGPAGPQGVAPADAHARVDYLGDAALLPDSAAVFVFLRAPGQRMPLAVGRFRPAQLPLRVAFGPVPEGGAELVARLSISGSVEGDGRDVQSRVAVTGRGDELELSLPAVSAAATTMPQ